MLLRPEIFLNNGHVLKVVSDRAVNLPQRQGRKIFLYLLGRRSLLELVNEGVERDARASDADGAIFAAGQRRSLDGIQFWHSKRTVRRQSGAGNGELQALIF